MLRRQALSLFAAALGRLEATGTASLDPYLDGGHGTALLVDVATQKLLAVSGAAVAARMLAPPGSTLKPFVLEALLRSGRLSATESYPCSGRLSIGTRNLDCSHPRVVMPMRIDTALAYSCNCFVAHAAAGFPAGALAAKLEAAGFAAHTGWFSDQEAHGGVEPAVTEDSQRMQALGEGSIRITAAELALAYCRLARRVASPEMQPILAGLEGAVEFGTAQRARVDGVQVAGKTGSVIAGTGEPIAWFAGFVPSRAPKVVAVVMLTGRSGGSDAAPVARRIFEAWRGGLILATDGHR